MYKNQSYVHGATSVVKNLHTTPVEIPFERAGHDEYFDLGFMSLASRVVEICLPEVKPFFRCQKFVVFWIWWCLVILTEKERENRGGAWKPLSHTWNLRTNFRSRSRRWSAAVERIFAIFADFRFGTIPWLNFRNF